ncbi:MAG TPA: helix-turn-helix domain-containing protein [Arsenophonus nasoniae]|uniref:helix-turn-helix domain-containing protein n=1 Tax=Arsenophonus nasoniae TaxID=638 RepID=UPI00387A313C
MSRAYGKKLRLIRQSEGLTQASMAKITGIAISAIKNYETQGVEVGISIIDRVLDKEEFRKYTMWLMTDEIAPSAGQIAPALAHCGTDGGEAQKQRRKTGENSDVRSSHYDQKTG